MYQNIVLGTETLTEIAKLPEREYHRIMAALATESIYCDADCNLFKEYHSLVEQVPDTEQNKLKLFIATLSYTGRPDKSVRVKQRVPTEYKQYLSEATIAAKDKTRIILADPLEPARRLKLYREQNLSAYTCNEYCHPPYNSPIRALERIFIESGQEFDFHTWLEKYLLGAERITIQDPYTFSNDIVLRDIVHILRSVKSRSVCPVRIIACRPDSNPTDDELIALLISKTNLKNISVKIDDSHQIKDRYLETQHFHIILGHSLGGVNRLTTRAKTEFEITVVEM